MLKSSFFDSIVDQETNLPDRQYISDDFAKYWGSVFSDGIVMKESSSFQIVAQDTPGMAVQYSAGANMAWIQGHFVFDDDQSSAILAAAADEVQDRIDSVVLRLDYTIGGRKITPIYIVGELGTGEPPALIRNSEYYDIRLANINMTAGTTVITGDMIQDTRLNTNDCGIVHALINQADTTTVVEQISADLVVLRDQSFADFEAWLETIQVIIDNDAATSLITNIQAIQNVPIAMQADSTHFIAYTSTIVDGGTGYVVGDIVNTTSGIEMTVNSVDVDGKILLLTISNPESLYTTDPAGVALATTGGSGNGLTVTVRTRYNADDWWDNVQVAPGTAGTGYVEGDEAMAGVVAVTYAGGEWVATNSSQVYIHNPNGEYSISGGSGAGATVNITADFHEAQLTTGSLEHVNEVDPLVSSSRVRNLLRSEFYPPVVEISNGQPHAFTSETAESVFICSELNTDDASHTFSFSEAENGKSWQLNTIVDLNGTIDFAGSDNNNNELLVGKGYSDDDIPTGNYLCSFLLERINNLLIVNLLSTKQLE